MTVMTNMILQVGGIDQANFADDQNNAHNKNDKKDDKYDNVSCRY